MDYSPLELAYLVCLNLLWALWANKVATRNGRSGYLYLLNGLLFGPFAVIAAYVNGPSEKRQIDAAAKRQAEINRLVKKYEKGDE